MVLGIVDYFKRRRAEQQPFPETWRSILCESVPFYPTLDEQARARFEDKLKTFALTKHFVAAGGMTIDETVKVTIAAAAARLSMNLPDEHYERLTEIVVYPSHYRRPGDDTVIYGEAHSGFGTVVLSYEAVVAGHQDADDGENTAMHELAHVLDGADGTFDGTPVLGSDDDYSPWARVMTQAFETLQAQAGTGRQGVLRSYGAQNPAEFFAVATEAFYEKPKQMRERHPHLYAALVDFYRADPAALPPEAGSGKRSKAAAPARVSTTAPTRTAAQKARRPKRTRKG